MLANFWSKKIWGSGGQFSLENSYDGGRFFIIIRTGACFTYLEGGLELKYDKQKCRAYVKTQSNIDNFKHYGQKTAGQKIPESTNGSQGVQTPGKLIQNGQNKG